MTPDPLDRLTDLGIALAWSQTMRRAAVWIPSEDIMVLNAALTRRELVDEVDRLLQLAIG